MRTRWRPEIPKGTSVEIRGARRPEWLAENRDNPLRDWDTRHHISQARYMKAVAQYKATRQAVHAALGDPDAARRLYVLGREYGVAFNKLDQSRPFIETEEREDLARALMYLTENAQARKSLLAGLDSVRQW
jgi:hypothetical protein